MSAGATSHSPQTISIDEKRFLALLDALAKFGADPTGGVTRLALSPAENDARAHIMSFARDAGLHPRIDTAGNLVITLAAAPSGRPVVAFGSHIDSVPGGGRLDGAYGVAAALEVLATLAPYSESLACEPVAVAFTNEEGSGFPCPFWGSRAIAGDPAPVEGMTCHDGRPLAEALRAAGGDPSRISEAAWRPHDLKAFIELHIEQGPTLAARGVPIGIVGGIVGRTIVDIEVLGQRNHAGTTPMWARKDALAIAARIVEAVEHLSTSRDLCAVSTVGVLDVHAPAVNVVPGRVSLTAEFRDADLERLRQTEAFLDSVLKDMQEEEEVEISTQVTMRSLPVPTDTALQEVIAAATRSLTLEHAPIFSGAGHDAQIMAAITPMAMVFVPSVEGISHSPEEHTEQRHLIAGAQVLARTVSAL
jgi:beta-ureidopropionase / N-carbamoyl-L-amino-acid hydrolase